MIDAAATPSLWLPAGSELPRPAIIRPAEHALLRPGAFRPMTRDERRATIAELVRTRRLTFGEAQRVMFFAPVAMWASSSPPITSAFLTRVTSTTAGTSFSFTSYSFGTADASRNIVVAVGGDASTTGAVPSLVTIGGVSATMLVGQAGSTGSNPPGVSLWMAAVPTGTSGTIAVTFAASHNACVVDGWSLKGPSSPALSSAAQTYAGTGNPSWSVSVLAGGVIIGAAATSGTASFTWSGLTERSDGTFGSRTYSAADLASATAQTITATGTPTGGTNRVGVIAALR